MLHVYDSLCCCNTSTYRLRTFLLELDDFGRPIPEGGARPGPDCEVSKLAADGGADPGAIESS